VNSQLKKRHLTGQTLVELMIAMALGLIITAAVYSMFMGVTKVSTSLIGEKDVTKRSRIIIAKLTNDVSEADLNKSTIINFSGKYHYNVGQKQLVAIALPRAYGVPDPKDPTSALFQTNPETGLPTWKSLHIYYILPETSDLRLKEIYPTDLKNFKPPITTGQLKQYCDGKNDRIVTKDVAYFNVEPIYIMINGKPVYINGDDNSGGTSESESKGKKEKRKKIGSLSLYLNLFYRNRRGIPSYHKINHTIMSRNSFYLKPGPSHSPYPTPTPPDKEPIVPSDWES